MFPLEAVKRLRLRSLKRDLPISYLIQDFEGLGKGTGRSLILQHADCYLIPPPLFFKIFHLAVYSVLKMRDLGAYSLQILIVNL